MWKLYLHKSQNKLVVIEFDIRSGVISTHFTLWWSLSRIFSHQRHQSTIFFSVPHCRISETKSSVRILTTISYRKNPPKSWTIFAALGIYALPICDGIHSKQQQQRVFSQPLSGSRNFVTLKNQSGLMPRHPVFSYSVMLSMKSSYGIKNIL